MKIGVIEPLPPLTASISSISELGEVKVSFSNPIQVTPELESLTSDGYIKESRKLQKDGASTS